MRLFLCLRLAVAVLFRGLSLATLRTFILGITVAVLFGRVNNCSRLDIFRRILRSGAILLIYMGSCWLNVLDSFSIAEIIM